MPGRDLCGIFKLLRGLFGHHLTSVWRLYLELINNYKFARILKLINNYKYAIIF